MNAFAGMMSTLAERFLDDVKHASGFVFVLHGVAEAEAADDAAVFYVVHDGVDRGVALAACGVCYDEKVFVLDLVLFQE